MRCCVATSARVSGGAPPGRSCLVRAVGRCNLVPTRPGPPGAVAVPVGDALMDRLTYRRARPCRSRADSAWRRAQRHRLERYCIGRRIPYMLCRRRRRRRDWSGQSEARRAGRARDRAHRSDDGADHLSAALNLTARELTTSFTGVNLTAQESAAPFARAPVRAHALMCVYLRAGGRAGGRACVGCGGRARGRLAAHRMRSE